MKEKVWVNIPKKYQEILCEWSKFYAYESENEETGKVVVYSLYTNQKEYHSLVTFLQKNNIHNYIFRRVYTFTKNEKDNAEILWFWTDDDAKDSYTLELMNCICNNCNKEVPFSNRSRIHVDYKKIRKYEIMSTYHGDTETIVSEKIKQLFIQEKILGAEFEPIYQIGKENMEIEGFYHLILQEGIGDVIEPSVLEKKIFVQSVVCGVSLYVKQP